MRAIERVWLPAIRAGSGSDVFVERLAAGLMARGVDAKISWFPPRYEFFPGFLSSVAPPAGTNIIHANAAQAFAFKRPGIPLVVTELHYVLDPGYRPYKTRAQQAYHRLVIGRWLSRSFASANAITAISHFTAQVLRETLHLSNVSTIPLWVDPGRFHPAAATPRRQGPFRLLFVGNGSRRKGADVLAPLAERLGEGFEILCTAGLRQQMPGGAPRNLRILGRLDEAGLVAAYQDCDAVLVPSRYEGFGYAALEGMSCGKPVVGFASGAIVEVVGPEAAALLAAVDDIDGLVTSSRRLAADPSLAAELGRRGRARACGTYDEKSAVVAYLALYRGLLGREY
jgi:alpha-maltose-1-phosphate synthase